MSSLLHQALAYPTVFFSALLAIVLVYWAFVVFGAVDIDSIDVGGGIDGMDGIDGLDGIDGASDAAAEGLGEAAEAAHEGLSFAGILGWLGLRSAPFTVVMSLVTLFAWGTSMLLNQLVAPLTDSTLPKWATAFVVLILSGAVGVVLTRFASKPLGPLFITHEAERASDLVGRTCRVETGTVDAAFGMATVEEGGAWARIQIRSESAEALRRGDQALIISWDRGQHAYRVEPLDARGGSDGSPRGSEPAG